MERITYSAICRNLDFNMDWVCNGVGPLLITRRNAGNVVLISAQDYEDLLETIRLLRSQANATRLLGSIGEADAAKPT